MIYLPEYHEFPHIAIVNWPVDPRHYQRDWVDSISILEQWLEQYAGPHLVEWAWHTTLEQQYYQACIAFRREKLKTLALITWDTK